jgi:hypothetical protein
MKNSKKLFILLILMAATLIVGCTEYGGDVIITQTRGESSFDLSKGVVYDIDVWVKNEAEVSNSATVTAELIVENTDQVRDSQTKTVNLGPSETKQVSFTLDGEDGVNYRYESYVNEI